MKEIFKNKKLIVIMAIIFFLLIFSFVIFKYFNNYSKFTNFNFNITYDKIRFSNNNIYIFNKGKFTKVTRSKKIEKEIPVYKKIEMKDDVIYALFDNSLVMYNKNFEKVKEVTTEKNTKDFFIENDKIILIDEKNITVFDETLNENFKKEDVNAIYLKFSKDNMNFMYTDYVKFDDSFKSRFHIVDLKSKKPIYDFTLYNEFIIDFGFINDSNENSYILTNEKLYIFEKNNIKEQIFIKNLKDISYSDGKLYILTDFLEVYDTKNLKFEKKLEVSNKGKNIYILKNKILLTNNTSYSLIDKKNYNIEDFPVEIFDVVKQKNIVYLILQDKYIKLK